MKKQGRIYAIVYSGLLILVAVGLLGLVNQWSRPKQQENKANEVRCGILRAARISADGKNVAEVFSTHIKRSYIVNYHGVVADRNPEHAFNACMRLPAIFKAPADRRKLAVFECATPHGIKYIVPVYGCGLWGPIWGYVAFDANGSTIYGAYFAQQSETPGLGAEIEKAAFSSQFEGKDIFSKRGRFESVVICKPGREPRSGSWVHGVSGSTVTSQGVSRMLRERL